MGTFLDRMARTSAARAKAARARAPIGALTRRAADMPAPLPLVLSGFDLIAELKLRSPAAGGLAGNAFDPARQLDAYAVGGAAAVSVLTEPTEFEGELAHLEMAAARLRASHCPVMRKDFLVDVYQVIEARAHGASGVLLIVAMLSDGDLDELLAAAVENGLFVLLEAFDEQDLDRLGRLGLGTAPGQLVGINSRDLKTLEVDFERFARLGGRTPPGASLVAESGIGNARDIAAVASLGFGLALVGSALMQDHEVARTVASFIAAGREAIAERA